MMRLTWLPTLTLLLANPLVAQDLRVRPIEEPPSYPLPALTLTDLDRAHLTVALLEQVHPQLVGAGGTRRLQVFVDIIPAQSPARDSLRTLAGRFPGVMLCGPGFSRCNGPNPTVRILSIESRGPSEAILTVVGRPGRTPDTWNRSNPSVHPAGRLDRGTELGDYYTSHDPGAPWNTPPAHAQAVFIPTPIVVVTRTSEGWLLAPSRWFALRSSGY